VSLGRDAKTRKRVRLSRTFKTKTEALDWKDEQRRLQRAGSLTATSLTLSEWLTTWLEVRKPVVSANTYRTERSTVDLHVRPGLGELGLRKLSALVIEKWLARLSDSGVSANERHKCGKLLRTCLNDAVKRRVIGASPMKGVPVPPAPESEAAALEPAQLDALIQAAIEHGHEAMFRLWADAGLRPGELYALLWEDFDPKAGTIRVRKSLCQTTGKVKKTKTKDSKRTLLLAPSTVRALDELSRPPNAQPVASAPLFPAPEGGHWWRASFMKLVFGPVARAAKLEKVLMPYTLRHTMATLLLRSGVSLKVVSERLGHKDVTTTLKTYAHILPGDQERAAAVMETILNPRPTGS
jgi:integrase